MKIDYPYVNQMNGIDKSILLKAKKIRLVIFDVDGVLTDGGIYISNDGYESKRFYAQDGHGIVLLKSIGIEVGIISGRRSSAVEARAKELGFIDVIQNSRNKKKDFEKNFSKKFSYAETCFVGDDTVDIELLEEVGLSVTVPNANFKLKEEAIDWITPREGGNGAVRDVCDLIYYSKNV